MDKFLGHDMPESQRKQFLADNCDAVEEIGYTRRFSELELAQRKENLAQVSIKVEDIEEEKRDYLAEVKEQLTPLNKDRKVLIEEIRRQAEWVHENCYKFIDREEGLVGYYNESGELVSSRPIMPQEMQKTIFNIKKTGTES